MKGLKIGTKLYMGFGIVLVMVIAIGLMWHEGLARQRNIICENEELLALKEQLRAMQMAHYQWVDSLRNSVRDRSAFTGQLDPTKCAFGKWYYSYRCAHPDLAGLLQQLEEPHKCLHKSGNEVLKAEQAGDFAAADKISLDTRQVLLPSLMAIYNPFMEEVGKVFDKGQKEADAFVQRQQKLAVGIMVFAAVLVFFLGLFLSRAITTPIEKVVAILKDIAQGEGDLTKRLAVDSKDEIGELATWFNTFMEKLHDIIYQVASTTGRITSATQELVSTAEEMTAGVEEQTTQTAQVAASMEEMSATVQQVAKNSDAAVAKAKGAGEAATNGGAVVSGTIQGMNNISGTVRELQGVITALSRNSTKIGDIVGVIDDVADQTNLLALNAAIEAARAGEQGRGFAVVADEVRKLAERTTSSTKEIAAMVKTIQEDTSKAVSSMDMSAKEVDNGVKFSGQAKDSLNGIVMSAVLVQEMIQQIATAAKQQSAAAGEISSNVESIALVSKQNAAAAKQTSSAAQDISQLADNLQQMVNMFKLNGTVEVRSVTPQKRNLKSA